MQIRTVEKLSSHREVTPEGYLLCRGAALARTGVMRYLAEDVDPEIMEGSTSKEALLYRDDCEVFDREAMASFEGKPFTLDHPEDDVTKENWQELARGVVMNVRRGDGFESDLLLADILVTDAEAIEALKKGLVELSCGYDSRLEKIRPGVGRQTHIRGNHVALVERGRAGGRCRINDKKEDGKMAEKNAKKQAGAKKAKTTGFVDRLRRLLKDAEAEEARADEEPKADAEPQTATDNDLAASLEEIKLMLRTLVESLKPAADEETPAADEEPGKTSDEEAADEEPCNDEEPDKTDEEEGEPKKDSLPKRLCDSKTAKAAQRLGLSGAREGDSAEAVQRGALSIAMRDSETSAIVRDIIGDVPLSKANPAAVRAAFLAVSAISGKTASKNTAKSLTDSGKKQTGPMTPAQLNKLNAEFYGGKK